MSDSSISRLDYSIVPDGDIWGSVDLMETRMVLVEGGVKLKNCVVVLIYGFVVLSEFLSLGRSYYRCRIGRPTPGWKYIFLPPLKRKTISWN